VIIEDPITTQTRRCTTLWNLVSFKICE